MLLSIPHAIAAESPPDAFVEIPASTELLMKLRQGGYVIYMRHGRTDSGQPDQVPIILGDCRTQRPLTDAGRDEIIQVGKAIKQAAIPVGEVFSSPLCRAVESAQLAYGGTIQTINELMYTAHLTSEEKLPVVAKTRELLSRPVAPGNNRIIVAHAPNLADVMAYFPRVEGTVIIFRPSEKNGFEYLASIHPGQWPELLRTLEAQQPE
jgi:phosphohistidine phosphatase SixA